MNPEKKELDSHETPVSEGAVPKVPSSEEAPASATVRISDTYVVDNEQDANRGFPPQAGRSPLAKVRNYLAGRRSDLADQRTALARGRTGLAFFRTGISLITIAVTLIRLFSYGLFLPFDLLLVGVGIAAVIDGLWWYLPVRKDAARKLDYKAGVRVIPGAEISPAVKSSPAAKSSPTAGATPGSGGGKLSGVTLLTVEDEETAPRFVRIGPVPGAEELRAGWSRLAPVERRRFLASDRTDLAEERTALASLRTTMAKARMGLAFTRSGVAFAGLGIVLVRKFPGIGWTYFDFILIVVGILMALEGFHWYLPGYRAGLEGLGHFKRSLLEANIWDEMFPPLRTSRKSYPPVKASHAPGIWGTTGLALERTVLADRRNLMSRLRTVMAYSRTGLAFIRSGMSISAVGAGLIAFLTVSTAWAIEA